MILKSMHYWIPLLLISFVSVSALEDGSTISVYFENDLFANTDEYNEWNQSIGCITR